MVERLLFRFALAALAATALLGMAGCTPQIGDQCVLSTDCSTQGTLVCDPTQPGGYCTEVNCQPDLCPNEAACVSFNATLPGCPYNDRAGPMGSRVTQTFCMKQCHHNSDCRTGYICADPRQPPWNAQIQDDDQTQHICIYPPTESGDASVDYDALVCQASGPDVGPLDAPITYSPDVSLVDAPADTGSEAGPPDGGADAAGDARTPDGGAPEAGAGEGGMEGGTTEAGPGDGGAADAPDAGG